MTLEKALKMTRKILGMALVAAFLPLQALCQTDSSGIELRKPRAWALSAEIGMNSLSSLIGPVATFYVKPQIGVDLGVGLSSVGLRPGLRARYLFSLEKLAYFGGIGLKYGLGTGGEEILVEDPDTKKKIGMQIDPSTYLDLMVGLDYLADNGFLILANAGFSALLGGKNFAFSSGTVVSEKTEKTFKTVFGSGIMLSVSLGKAF